MNQETIENFPSPIGRMVGYRDEYGELHYGIIEGCHNECIQVASLDVFEGLEHEQHPVFFIDDEEKEWAFI